MELEIVDVVKVLVTVAVASAVVLILRLYDEVVRKPAKVRERLRKQGLTGPPPALLIGNAKDMKAMRETMSASAKPAAGKPAVTHNYTDYIAPFFVRWRKQYGQLFMFSQGNKQIIHVTRPDVVKEMTQTTSFDLGRPVYHRKMMTPLFGEGILTSNGLEWQFYKKTLAPELHMDKVKGMTTLVYECSAMLLDTWKRKVAVGGGVADIDVDEDMYNFSGDVISKACFGSNYEDGKEIFARLNKLKEAMAVRKFSLGFPGMSYLPTKTNREIWRRTKEIDAHIMKIVKERRRSKESHDDMLQTILAAAESSNMDEDWKQRFVIGNCKNIYQAAHASVAIAAAWCLMLLASSPDWQDRVRAEVREIWGGQVPDYEKITKAKLLTMVMQETLRLYPTGIALSREALNDIKIGGIEVPKGVNIWTMVSALHTDPEAWGPDSFTFRPDRFANGISAACKIPHSYLPFGFGPRVCPGQYLAMLQLKMTVGLILAEFSLSLSPEYVHAPVLTLVIEPKHGIKLSVRKL